ncbi:hypothetical protein [Sphingomonas sp.]|uniref:hypothetical protein n=1 Tax=Sphingomonas sp. TaxID=28214 RepID=UPI003B3A8010
MGALLIVNGLVATGAVVASVFACSRDRVPATICATALLASWVLYVLAWTPWSPAMFLSAYVVDTDSIDLWSISDAGVGLLALAVARDRWWGALLYGLMLSSTLNDALYWLGLVQWKAFSGTADIAFLAEESIFFVLGGRNAADLLFHLVGGWVRRVRAGFPMVGAEGLR